jgi:streptogramin lyase
MKTTYRISSLIKAVSLLASGLIIVGNLTSVVVLAAAPTINGDITTLTSNSYPFGITTTPNGDVWFTEQNANQLGQLSPTGTLLQQPGGLSTSSEPQGITVGPDGNLWFTEFNQNQIGVMSPGGTLINQYSVSGGANPNSITVGPNGNLWFTESSGDAIGTMTTSGSGLVEYSTEYNTQTYQPSDITVLGNDLWFTATLGSTSAIGEMNTSGQVIEMYPVTSNSDPEGITVGPDGNLWFTEFNGNAIGTITPSGTGLEEYPLASGAKPEDIVAGANNNLWFTEANASEIGEVQLPARSTQGTTSNAAITPKSPDTGLAATEIKPTIALATSIFAACTIIVIAKRLKIS